MSNGSQKDQQAKHIDWEKEGFAPLDTKRPTIPKFVAEYINKSKEDGYSLMYILDQSNHHHRVGEWLESDDDNVQLFLNYYKDPKSCDVECKELYVIKAPKIWDTRRDLYIQHIETYTVSWIDTTSNIEQANTFSREDAIGFMKAFGIDWELVKV